MDGSWDCWWWAVALDVTLPCREGSHGQRGLINVVTVTETRPFRLRSRRRRQPRDGLEASQMEIEV